MPAPRPLAAKAALLDFDMTLVDSLPAIVEATNRFADDIGRPRVTREIVLGCIGLPLEGTWVEFWGGFDPSWPEIYRGRYKRFESQGFRLFPDTLDTLSALRGAGVKTCVVTNRGMASFAVESAGLGQWVDAAVGADDVRRPKPDPEPVLKALELLGAGPGEAVYVGDTAIDIQAAQGAGVFAVGITTGAIGRGELERAGADQVIDRLGELLGVIGL